MAPTDPIGGDRNPERGAITGAAPPAAEAPPAARGRRGALIAPVWIYALAGIALIVTALIADQDTNRAIGTALAGVVLLALSGLSIAGVIDIPEAAGVGILLAVVLAVLAFVVSQAGLARGMFLACAAAVLLTAFASLAAAHRGPQGSEGEPGPGVRNV